MITTLAVRDEDEERAVAAVEALITRTARNSAGGYACLSYDEIVPLAQKIVRLIAQMQIGCVLETKLPMRISQAAVDKSMSMDIDLETIVGWIAQTDPNGTTCDPADPSMGEVRALLDGLAASMTKFLNDAGYKTNEVGAWVRQAAVDRA
jgi:hypothetical protein